MALYKIHRMKDAARQTFRWAAHTPGAAMVKPKDYEEAGLIDAASPYSAWAALAGTDAQLEVGDVLEDGLGSLRIYKYVGFEPAQWVLPEVRSGLDASAPLAALPSVAGA